MTDKIYIVQWDWDEDKELEVFIDKKTAISTMGENETLYEIDRKHQKEIIKT